jgi:hypothetical protein
VQLFDQDGNPVNIGQPERAYTVTADGALRGPVPATDATGRQRWNTYPLRRTVIEPGLDPTTGLPRPQPTGPAEDAVPPLTAAPSIQAPTTTPIPTATPSPTPSSNGAASYRTDSRAARHSVGRSNHRSRSNSGLTVPGRPEPAAGVAARIRRAARRYSWRLDSGTSPVQRG